MVKLTIVNCYGIQYDESHGNEIHCNLIDVILAHHLRRLDLDCLLKRPGHWQESLKKKIELFYS